MADWNTKRNTPYTAIGIVKLKCIRCGRPAKYQWQICSDGNNYRPLCGNCDAAINRLVLRWMKHPNASKLISEYDKRVLK